MLEFKNSGVGDRQVSTAWATCRELNLAGDVSYPGGYDVAGTVAVADAVAVALADAGIVAVAGTVAVAGIVVVDAVDAPAILVVAGGGDVVADAAATAVALSAGLHH